MKQPKVFFLADGRWRTSHSAQTLRGEDDFLMGDTKCIMLSLAAKLDIENTKCEEGNKGIFLRSTLTNRSTKSRAADQLATFQATRISEFNTRL